MDGDTTPSITDHTDFGSMTVSSGTITRTFTISNTGDGSLSISSVDITGTHAGDFTVTTQPDSSVPPGETTTFSVLFNPSAEGLRIAVISIANNDSDENPYDFAIQGTGTTAPDIDIRGNGISISDGDDSPSTKDHTYFGDALVSSGTVTRTFTIYNTGDANLNLTGDPVVELSGINEADFSVSQLPNSPVTPDGSTTFTITFDPSAEGLRSANVSIANNDSDENPYDFAIQGEGYTPESKYLIYLPLMSGK